jgi:hypothetical protein
MTVANKPMIFDLRHLDVEVFKKFDGICNYFNPSHFNGKTIFRRESKFENKLLFSDIVDDQDNIILQHRIDENYLWSYEDARFINENEISVCCCKRDKNRLGKIINVEFKKYNLTTKEFTHFKTQNSYFEKHWQFYSDKIIYHVNPYTILDLNENIIYKNLINWQPWIEKYGNPGLSTNIFELNSKKYLLFHSYIALEKLYFKYYVGIMSLDNDLKPIGYSQDALFESNKSYSDPTLLESLWQWRNTELAPVVKYEVIFPMNVVVDNENINIYSGLNDCSAVNIKIDKQVFIDEIKNQPFVLV